MADSRCVVLSSGDACVYLNDHGKVKIEIPTEMGRPAFSFSGNTRGIKLEGLSCGDLNGANLHHFTFINCNFRGATFRGAVMRHMIFEGCDLRGAEFGEADLEGTKFIRCKLDGVFFPGTLIDCVFEDADMGNSCLLYCNLKGVQLINCRGSPIFEGSKFFNIVADSPELDTNIDEVTFDEMAPLEYAKTLSGDCRQKFISTFKLELDSSEVG